MSVHNDPQLAEVVVLCDTNGARTRAAAERRAPRCVALTCWWLVLGRSLQLPQVVQGHFPDRACGCNLARGGALGLLSPWNEPRSHRPSKWSRTCFRSPSQPLSGSDSALCECVYTLGFCCIAIWQESFACYMLHASFCGTAGAFKVYIL